MAHQCLITADWLPRLRGVALALAAIFCWADLCVASDETHKWTVIIHKNGREVARKVIPKSTSLHDEIESTKNMSVAKSRTDFVTSAPSIRIESDLERIELQSKTVVYSSRKTIDDAWHQRSRRSKEADRLLRQKIETFAEDSK